MTSITRWRDVASKRTRSDGSSSARRCREVETFSSSLPVPMTATDIAGVGGALGAGARLRPRFSRTSPTWTPVSLATATTSPVSARSTGTSLEPKR